MNRHQRAARIGALKRRIYREFMAGRTILDLSLHWQIKRLLAELGLPKPWLATTDTLEQIIREKSKPRKK